MSAIWGNNIKLSIFGESHGEAIGVIIDGLSSGFDLNLDYINYEMSRRAPGRNTISTSRKEEDNFKILSGYFNGKTTGTPLCAMIKNQDKKSKDYSKIENIMRPGHADYTGAIKYGGFNDYRGGGHFSGRITAALVFAGAVCRQLLESRGVIIGSHIKSIKDLKDESFDYNNIEEKVLKKLRLQEFPTIDQSVNEKMKELILKAKKNMDSVGGVIECAAINLDTGLGEPFFDSVESSLSHLLFSIPAVKAVEFGSGFSITEMFGSEANDEFYYDNNRVKTYSNNNGGILGGITNGRPLVFRCAIKPTPSIGKVQNTIDISKKENVSFSVEGRHDPCIVQRAVPVVESVAAISLLDFYLN
ncbi:chorismate synthase [Haloimpatiens sp. FM7315]|uniref:chorismate synthase n=1 Tax=Haloimpatiens sp. FM7315 TaxID=3298609 RepID=UPI00370C0CA1